MPAATRASAHKLGRPVGITNQRETTVLWDRATGQPLHRAIVWQDRRTAGICDDLRAAGLGERFQQRTGLVLDAYFSGTKGNPAQLTVMQRDLRKWRHCHGVD